MKKHSTVVLTETMTTGFTFQQLDTMLTVLFLWNNIPFVFLSVIPTVFIPAPELRDINIFFLRVHTYPLVEVSHSSCKMFSVSYSYGLIKKGYDFSSANPPLRFQTA